VSEGKDIVRRSMTGELEELISALGEDFGVYPSLEAKPAERRCGSLRMKGGPLILKGGEVRGVENKAASSADVKKGTTEGLLTLDRVTTIEG